MAEIKGVVFDLDGTIIDSLEAYCRAFNDAVKQVGLEPVAKEKLAELLNRAFSLGQILQELFPSLEMEIIPPLMQEIRRSYIAVHEKHVPLQPGAKEAVSQLKERGFKIGVATGRMTSGERKWGELRRLGIAPFIDAVVTAAEAGPKPAPDSICQCVQELGLSPEECAYVGDSQADIIAGKAARVTTIAVASGVAARDLLSREQPDLVLDSLAELMAHIG